MIEVPVRNDLSWYSELVDLAGVIYLLTFAWNTRDERWYMDIAQEDGTTLINGIPLVVDFPLLSRFASNLLPAGMLMAVDNTGGGEEAEDEDLGDRVKLIFYPVSEF